jgi:hypothetical protein
MKMRIPLAIASLAGILFVFSSCQKDIDAVNQQDEVMGTPLPGQVTYCRIESFWERPFAMDQVFRIVGYDLFENPTFISTPMVSTGSPFHTFKYDGWHRLIEYAQVFGNGNFLTLHHYGFDNNGRIGVDTAWNLGGFNSMGGPANNYNNRVISILTYDAQGRIIHSSNIITAGPMFPPVPPISSVNTYTYDAAGNLEVLGATYDNKMNINRTNDIWQFLARDYSKNNRLMATAYNSTGFPTTINQLEEYRFINSNDIRLNNSQIGYMCRPATF